MYVKDVNYPRLYVGFFTREGSVSKLLGCNKCLFYSLGVGKKKLAKV
jgi:hypothetical protein